MGKHELLQFILRFILNLIMVQAESISGAQKFVEYNTVFYGYRPFCTGNIPYQSRERIQALHHQPC